MNNIKKIFFFPLLLLYFHAFSFAYPPLGEEEFKTIKNISENLSQECPRESCLVIGIGRSPTAVIAFLQANTDVEAINVPLSGIKGIYESEKHKEILFPHFKKFIDSQKLLNTKKVILVDYTLTGLGFLAGAFYLKKYFDEDVRLSASIEAKAITGKKNPIVIKSLFKEEEIPVQIITLDPKNEFFISLDSQRYDDVSEFGPFYMFQKSVEKVVNPKYNDLKELMNKMPQMIVKSKEELEDEFKNNNSEIRAAAAKLFVEKSNFQNPDDIIQLKNRILATDDQNPTLLSSVMKLFEIIHQKNEKVIQYNVEALKWLVSHINNKNSLVRKSIISVLKVIKPDNLEIIKSLIFAIENENKEIRDSVVDALVAVELKNLELLKLLAKKINNPNEEIRKSVISSLQKLDLSKNLELTRELTDVIMKEVYLATDDPAINGSVIDALAKLKTQDIDILEYFVELLEEDDSPTRTSAVNALKEIAPNNPKILELLATKLARSSSAVRASIVEILTDMFPTEENKESFDKIILSITALLDLPNELENTIVASIKWLKIRLYGQVHVKLKQEIYRYFAKALQSDKENIRLAGRDAFQGIRIEKASQNYLKVLLPLLENPDESVRDLVIDVFRFFYRFFDGEIDQEILNKIKDIKDISDVMKRS